MEYFCDISDYFTTFLLLDKELTRERLFFFIAITQSWVLGNFYFILPRLPYGATPGGHALRVSMQTPFLYRVTPSRRHRLAAAKTSVGIP